MTLEKRVEKEVIKKIPCERYSRVVGYFSRVDGWNEGKKAEFKDRKTYKIDYNKIGEYKK